MSIFFVNVLCQISMSKEQTLTFHSNENNILSQISMEERMACGQGACVGCSISTDDGMKKVCYDGPVFYSKIFRNVCDNRGDNNG